MSSTLHEAIAAARAGDNARAQIIAADLVREDPDDPNGWYLLSQLVDSDARRAAYLGKTLALDPDHARARIEFDALPPALVNDLRPAAAPVPATTMEQVASPPPSIEDAADVPEWLQPLAPEAVAPIVTPAGVAPAPLVPAHPRPKAAARPAPARKNSGNQALTILLALLALLTVVVLVFLVYLLFF
ncbi:MAG: hypothetical protein KIS95_12905 [Anaerolineae bacterium]|uniref:hypothetical protein n=1 Tax=Promineifilum sp. TaxID=2664178 RepID=UPI0024121305|nr:hypothetical protein [Promineifilum sp.]MCW5848127.1 hypothetical protein [Anaerolineae bacterium]